VAEPVNDWEQIVNVVKQLLAATEPDKKVRLLGVSLSNFGTSVIKTPREESTDQLRLF
jgi:DNA polymerase-4